MSTLSIFTIVAAFGGGVIGAYMGALPVFILTGVIAIAGGIATMAGAADLSIGFIAFGSYLGPHVAFAGGVGAAAYAGRMKKLESGTDILSSLNGIADPMTLFVGGIFGVLGAIIFYLVGTVTNIPTDHPATGVLILALVARFAFGKTGLTGKYEGKGKREWFTGGNGMICNILLGLGIGTAVGFVPGAMKAAGVADAAIGAFPVVAFGIAAVSLIFTQTGFATPATHHIAYPAACAAVWSGNPIMGIVFGILGALLGDFFGKSLNSHVDTHIDPPATTIFVLIFVATMLFQ